MSDKMSSSSASSWSSSSKNDQENRLKESCETVVAGDPEETEENGCKRRRKSLKNNNDVDVEKSPLDTDCDVASAVNGANALSMVVEIQRSISAAKENLNENADSGSVLIVDETIKVNDEENISSISALETPEQRSDPEENSAAEAPAIETSECDVADEDSDPLLIIDETVAIEPSECDISYGTIFVADEVIVIDDSEDSETDTDASARNSERAADQPCRIRQRSSRLSAPEMPSVLASHTVNYVVNNVSNNVSIDAAADSYDDSGDSDFAPFVLDYDTQSSESDHDILSSDDGLYLSSESEILISDDDNQRVNSIRNDLVMGLVDKVLSKNLSACSWNTTMEIMRRETGISGRFGGKPMGHNYFNNRFYASQFVMERMKLSHILRRRSGCVNSLNFNRTGDLLCSGSDDKRIVIWDWARNKVKYSFPSGHKENIFQTKFITGSTELDIVSAGRDGQVRRAVIPSSATPYSSCLYKHRDAVHKLVICPRSSFEILSVGEDGYIRHCDLRSPANSLSLLKVVNNNNNARNKVRLFSISHHPFLPEICVSGSDEYVRVYDKRKFEEETISKMCPTHLSNTGISEVTCCKYNHNGSEILATYNDEQIYLFGNTNYTPGSFLHVYRGHYNHRTIKGVNFFGPNSEYVISGSDCGNIFFWDKATEAIINFMLADSLGVVNCLEPHPSIPVLATSGLDYSVKIFAPGSERTAPDKAKIKTCITRNIWRSGLEGRIDHYDLLDGALNDIIEAFHPDVLNSDDSISDSSLVDGDGNNTSSSSSRSANGSPSTGNNDHQYFAHHSDDSNEN